jgi:hypothetical protein
MMEMVTTTERIAKQLNKLVEGDFTWRRTSHPLHSTVIVLLDNKCGIELLNEMNIVVTLDLHKLVQPHPFYHPRNILKVTVF